MEKDSSKKQKGVKYMQLEIKQISSMEKVRTLTDATRPLTSATVLKGERFSFHEHTNVEICLTNKFLENIMLYAMKKLRLCVVANYALLAF